MATSIAGRRGAADRGRGSAVPRRLGNQVRRRPVQAENTAGAWEQVDGHEEPAHETTAVAVIAALLIVASSTPPRAATLHPRRLGPYPFPLSSRPITSSSRSA
jgi:hypothetical protein